jgi:hypothetical protein
LESIYGFQMLWSYIKEFCFGMEDALRLRLVACWDNGLTIGLTMN